MSAENSIARSGREAEPQTERGFEIPPDLATRYEVRAIAASESGEQRLGLFRPGDRETPAIEITDNRIVARSEDAETIASLVKIAQHNGWDRVDVDGSPEFRKAVWSAATREGLTVSGYEPTFAEQERVDGQRGAAGDRSHAEITEPPRAVPQADAGDGTRRAASSAASREQTAQDRPSEADGAPLSEADRRLLLTLSRHTEDRKALYGEIDQNRDTFQRQVQFERIDVNREALENALERALESPTLVKAFEKSGYEPDALREMGKGGAWDTEVADAIYIVRSGLNRDAVAKEPGAAAALADEIVTDREDRSVADSIEVQGRVERQTHPVRAEQERDAAERRHESEELAELFLHGGAERLAADPRLANALQAQTAMEQHIGEVFDGDASQMVSASLESRKMISDVLRRGLDVSVREQTPVRQIEAMHTQLDLER